jgi:hypothetical protein
MTNFEMIDDYVGNRLSETERVEFEEAIKADPLLRAEVGKQNLIVDGIRKARATELKAMLNKVPIGGASASLWSGWTTMRMAATLGAVTVISTGLYFYLKGSEAGVQHVPAAEVTVDSLMPDDNSLVPAVDDKVKETEDKKETVSPQVKKTNPKKEVINSPKMEVVDPSEEMLSDDKDGETTTGPKSGISVSTIKVERDSQSKQYSFHYQFWEGKLFLFGPFDEALYEILELHGENHSLFLFFKDSFYLLDQSKEDVMALTPIQDRTLIRKLKEFRSGK